MKVKELIKELQKFNPELEIFLDDFMSIKHINHLRKIKVMTDKEKHFWQREQFGAYETFETDRYNKKAMNTKYPQAVLISDWQHYKKKAN